MCGCVPCGGVGGGRPGPTPKNPTNPPPPKDPPDPPPDPPKERVGRPDLPMGYGVLVRPDGSIRKGLAGAGIPKVFAHADTDLKLLAGRTGPRMFLITYAAPAGKLGSPPSLDVENAHVAWLGELFAAGRLFFAGHDTTGESGMLIVSAEAVADAKKLAARDPVIVSGFYRSIDVKEIAGPYPKR